MLLVCQLEMLDREEVSCILWDMLVKTSDEVSDAEIITEPSFWKALQALIDDILP